MSGAIEYAILMYAVSGLAGGFRRSVKIVPGMTGIRLGWLPCSPVRMGQETWDRAKATADQINRKLLT